MAMYKCPSQLIGIVKNSLHLDSVKSVVFGLLSDLSVVFGLLRDLSVVFGLLSDLSVVFGLLRYSMNHSTWANTHLHIWIF